MRKRSEAKPPTGVAKELPKVDSAPKKEEPKEVVVRHDPVNEQVVFAAALVDKTVRDKLADRLQPDHFLVPMHKTGWKGVQELHHRKLEFDAATFQQIVGSDSFDVNYLAQLVDARPYAPANLEFHVETLLWDKARYTASTGPIASLIDAIKDPRETPERVKALARQVPESLEGYKDRSFLHDGRTLVMSQMDDIRERRRGRAHFPFGIDGLDYFEPIEGEKLKKRLIPGAAPKKVTVVVGTSGSGKSTLCANFVLGLRRMKRRGLVGAWEMNGGTTLELCAAIEEGISLVDLRTGAITDEEEQRMEAQMLSITETVMFMSNPFHRKRGEKSSNERNLDLLQGYIADSGCEWVILDLWRRALRKIDPEEEEQALVRQQAMAEETNTHHILVQQLRNKDLEARQDKRPTRESIKGSGAWIEIADTILGCHRPALWKNIEDTSMEVFVLKQRFGKWPLGIELDWNGEYGKVQGGKSIPYEPPDGESSTNAVDGAMAAPKTGGKKPWSRGRRV
jgi:replicative DNA helicase